MNRLLCLAIPIAGVLLAGCRTDRVTAPPPASPAVAVVIELSSRSAAPGERLTAAVVIAPTGSAVVHGAQGYVRYDPSRVEFVGQDTGGDTFVLVNWERAAEGELRLLAFDLGGGPLPPRAIRLVFEVRRQDYAASFSFDPEVVASPALERITSLERHREPLENPELESAWPPDLRSIIDWARLLDLNIEAFGEEYIGPGSGTIFGDAITDGVIDVLDALATSNASLSVGPLLGDEMRDFAVAANIVPTNSPGIGGPGDPVPPGLELDGRRIIDVLDALAINNESLNIDHPIGGEPIPGRGQVPGAREILTGTIGADTTLTRDRIWELQGTVLVDSGVVLTIESGTRIEGAAGSRLVVRSAATIEAVGQLLLPIVFTCVTEPRFPGCWEGLIIEGFAFLNNGIPPPSGEVLPCPIKDAPSGGLYGGCRDHDDSGALSYVRVEYGGRTAGGSATPALQLLGVGYNTQLDHIQVRESAGDAVFLSGGRAQLRYLVVSNNGARGVRWDDGWRGAGQWWIAHLGTGEGAALLGSNAATDPNAGPRSFPRLSQVTVVGPGGSGTGSRGLQLLSGSGARLQNAVLTGINGPAIEVQGADACALGASDSILVEASIFFQNNPDVNDPAGCIDFRPPNDGNRVVDPLLLGAFATRTPDYRPAAGSPAGVGSAVPPLLTPPFFDQTQDFLGGVDLALSAQNNIPWYAGWTIGF